MVYGAYIGWVVVSWVKPPFKQSVFKSNKFWALLVIVGVLVGVVLKLEFYDEEDRIRGAIKAIEDRLFSYYLSQLDYPVDTVAIDLPFEGYQSILFHKAKTMAMLQTNIRPVLITKSSDYVSATLRHNGQAYPIKMRLKGDLLDHVWGDKWSFRVRLRKGRALFGLKKFSLQSPKTRGFLYEWLYQELLGHEDVLRLRYRFVNVVMNGKALGVYALEEHFDKYLLEHQARRDAPILRFNEDHYFKSDISMQSGEAPIDQGRLLMSAAEILPFQFEKVRQNSDHFGLFLLAQQLLRSAVHGTVPIDQVIDMTKMARYMAANHLVGAYHSLSFTNARFYINPLTLKLEPIGFDGNPGHSLNPSDLAGQMAHKLFGKLFKNDQFKQAYRDAVSRMTEATYIPSFLNQLGPPGEALMTATSSGPIGYPTFVANMAVISHNQRVMAQFAARFEPADITVSSPTNSRVATLRYALVALVKGLWQ